MSDKTTDVQPDKKRSFITQRKRWLFWRKPVEPLKPFALTDLAPKDDAHHDDKTKTYFRALRGALDNERVTNIAITGHYGCGKSSILRTYEKHFCDGHKFLNISLATFGQDDDPAKENGQGKSDNTQENKKLPKENEPQANSPKGKTENKACDDNEQKRTNYLVEHSILQQIVYQVPKASIPRSRFKRIGRPSSLSRTWHIFLLWGICLGAGIAVFRPDFFKPVTLLYPLITELPGWSNTILSLYSLGTIFIPVGLLFQFINTGALRRFRLKACELEMADDKDPSMLNKHLDEILYFFDATDYNVVVIEDLDRFGTPDVFTKLREINTLINQNRVANRGKGKKRSSRVVFIYAIKDEMFTGEERTKFFDMIIPVMPVVNFDNSRELLNRELSNILQEKEFKSLQNLIKEISRYIADMRLLYNIVNEFAVYRDRLNLKGLTDEELLALMAYKNIMPQDFAPLQVRRGLLFAYFKQKESCRKVIIAAQEKIIAKKRNELECAKQCALQSAQELRSVYIYHLQRLAVSDYPQYVAISAKIGNEWKPINDLMHDDLFLTLIQPNHIPVRTVYTHGGGPTVTVSTVELQKAVDESASYTERINLISLKSEGRTRVVENEIRCLEEDLVELKHAKLAQLMQRSEFTVPDAKEFLANINEHEFEKKKQLVEMLLRKGYIKEDYEAYLSYFYEGVLSNKGRVFVMAVQNGQDLDPDYELDRESILEVIEDRLTEHEVAIQATRNIYVLNYLLENNRVGDAIIAQFKVAPEISDILLLLLQKPDMAHKELVNTMFDRWPEFWGLIIDSDRITKVEADIYLSAMIKHANPNVIEKICNASNLDDYICSRSDFLRFTESFDTQRVLAFLDVVKPEFSGLSHFPKRSRIAEHIYEKGYYEVNADMLKLVYRTFVNDSMADDLPTLTQLLSGSDKPHYSRIMDNLEAFVDELSTMGGVLNREKEETAIWLLNNDDISHELRLKLASGQLPSITHLDDIDEDEAIWRQLIDTKSIIPSWENIWTYLTQMSDGELDKTLTTYIRDEEVASTLCGEIMKPDYLANGDNTPNLGLLLLHSTEFARKNYAQLMLAVPSDFTVISLASVNHAAIALLLDDKRVQFTPANYEIVRAKCHALLAAFVKDHMELFIEAVDELTIDGVDLYDIISLPYQRPERKKQIAEIVLRKGISGKLSAVADTLCGLFINDHAFAEGLGPETVSRILVALPEIRLKVEVLSFCIPWLEDEQIAAVLQSAGGDYAKLTEHGKRSTFPKNDRIETFATALKQRGFISRKVDKGATITLTTPFGARKSEVE